MNNILLYLLFLQKYTHSKRNIMKIKYILWLFFCSTGFINCDKEEDDGSRAFMQKATITGDSINGYYCYMDGGGLAVSHDRRLEDIERGYFSIQYLEEDWSMTADKEVYIRNAYVLPYSVYDVIRPISLEEAGSRHITDKDSCSVPPLFSIEQGYRGYFDFNTGLSVVNQVNVEKMPVEMNMVYDPAKQTPDTLRLEFCYHPRIPDHWTKTNFDYGSTSCDISSLATLRHWSDSVTIVVETGDGIQHRTKISKKDFLKPERKIE